MKINGKVINIISNIFYVQTEEGIFESTSRGIFKNKDIKPVVGDNVVIEIQNETGNIIEVLDRKNYIKRPKMANLTQLILVISATNPEPDLLMLDKQLAYAEFLNIKPIIIINKIDLDTEKRSEKIKNIYTDIGYKVITTVAKEQINLEEVEAILKNNVSAFSGNSGVGKSTLINALLKEKKTQEGELSIKNQKGKNTTTSVKLYDLRK